MLKSNFELEPNVSERELKYNDNFGQMYKREIEYAGKVISKLECRLWAWKCIEQLNQLRLMEHIGDDIGEDMKSYLQCLEIKKDELESIANERKM